MYIVERDNGTYLDVIKKYINQGGVLFWKDRRDGEQGTSPRGKYWEQVPARGRK